jgi:tRNA-dihydrouridine synthase C
MDGVTDWLHREVLTALCEHQSGISFCVSEFVRVTDRPAPAKVLLRMCPELSRGGKTAAGVPVVVQLLGGEPEPLARTAELAVELGAPAIDLNFGCPAKTGNRHDGGATLLKHPARIEAIVGAVRAALPAAVPVSAKIRLGWECGDHVATLARAAEAGGASWLTIHGRTRSQGYGGHADWDAIGRARECVGIEVIANGDLTSPARVESCRAQSGCRAFMLGRGALARPQIFRELRGMPAADGRGLLGVLLPAYARRMLATGESERAVLNRLKQWLCLASRVAPELTPRFEAIKRGHVLTDALDALSVQGYGEYENTTRSPSARSRDALSSTSPPPSNHSMV